MDAQCRKENSSEICSNSGDCICGQCVCNKRENPKEVYSGKYCDCDNFKCDRFNGLICGGDPLSSQPTQAFAAVAIVLVFPSWCSAKSSDPKKRCPSCRAKMGENWKKILCSTCITSLVKEESASVCDDLVASVKKELYATIQTFRDSLVNPAASQPSTSEASQGSISFTMVEALPEGPSIREEQSPTPSVKDSEEEGEEAEVAPSKFKLYLEEVAGLLKAIHVTLGLRNGVCKCRVCECFLNFSGSACDCSEDISTCMASNGQLCNGRGTCECGRCKCADPKFHGQKCEMCQTCLGVCAEQRECVQCRAFHKGEKQEGCDTQCAHFNLTMVDSRDKLSQPGQEDALTRCKEKDVDDCWFYYTYSVNSNSEVHVHVVKDPECPSGPEIVPIVAGVVAGIVLIGLALLLIWKLLIMIHDKREFAKFEKEKMNAKWDARCKPDIIVTADTVSQHHISVSRMDGRWLQPSSERHFQYKVRILVAVQPHTDAFCHIDFVLRFPE
ncbi:hypothetical protein AB205_0165150, partial [Aquarana catesbeiana]